MNPGVRADVRAIFYTHVSRKCGSVGHDDAVADYTIVSDMRLGHDQTIVARLRQHAAARCSAVDRHELANLVSLSDARLGRFAFVLQILRGQPDRDKREDLSFRANHGPAIDDAMRFQPHAVAEFHFGADGAVRPDEAVVTDAGA